MPCNESLTVSTPLTPASERCESSQKIQPEELTGLDPRDVYLPASRIGVLMIHGLTGTPAEMKFVAKRLNRHGFTVLCPRLAGHCGKESELLDTSWQDWAQSVHAAYEKLATCCDVIFAGGLSCGAVLSLNLTQTFPGKIRGLSLYSITLRWDGWSITKLRFLLPLVVNTPYFGIRYRFKETYPYGIKDERLRQMVLRQMESGDAEAAGFSGTPGYSLRELWRMVDVIKPKLAQTKTPTLLMHAKEDDIASIGNSFEILNALGGPTKLIALEDSYHMITIDKERQLVADETAAYFADLLSVSERNELAQFEVVPIPASKSASIRP